MLPSLVLKSQGLEMGRGPERERERERERELARICAGVGPGVVAHRKVPGCRSSGRCTDYIVAGRPETPKSYVRLSIVLVRSVSI